MRKKMKFASGGDATQQARFNRKTADIESDYQKALKSGKDAMVAKAKYEQRMADARDDLAKWTRADRTQTRAAESAAEAALSEARRTKGRSIADRDLGSRINPAAPSEPIKIATPKMDISTPPMTSRPKPAASRPKPAASRPISSGRSTSGGEEPWYGRREPAKSAAPSPVSTPAVRQSPTPDRPAGAPSLFIGTRAAKAQDANASSRASSDLSALGEIMRRGNQAGYAYQAAQRAKQAAERAKELAAQAEEDRRRREPAPRASEEDWTAANIRYLKGRLGEGPKPVGFKKGGSVKKKPAAKKACGGGMKYAKGGSIDGCAIRGKTRAKRTK